jgi:hypothetical protein
MPKLVDMPPAAEAAAKPAAPMRKAGLRPKRSEAAAEQQQ